MWTTEKNYFVLWTNCFVEWDSDHAQIQVHYKYSKNNLVRKGKRGKNLMYGMEKFIIL